MAPVSVSNAKVAILSRRDPVPVRRKHWTTTIVPSPEIDMRFTGSGAQGVATDCHVSLRSAVVIPLLLFR